MTTPRDQGDDDREYREWLDRMRSRQVGRGPAVREQVVTPTLEAPAATDYEAWLEKLSRQVGRGQPPTPVEGPVGPTARPTPVEEPVKVTAESLRNIVLFGQHPRVTASSLEEERELPQRGALALPGIGPASFFHRSPAEVRAILEQVPEFQRLPPEAQAQAIEAVRRQFPRTADEGAALEAASLLPIPGLNPLTRLVGRRVLGPVVRPIARAAGKVFEGFRGVPGRPIPTPRVVPESALPRPLPERPVTLTPRGDVSTVRPPAPFEPAPAGGFPSGRVPGGIHRQVPLPPRDPYQELLVALTPEREPFLSRIREAVPQQFYDRNFPLKELELATGIPVRKLAQIVPGSFAAGEDIVRRLYVPVVRRIGSDRPYLEEYLVLRRMEDVLIRPTEGAARRLPGGLAGHGDIQQAQASLLRRIGPQRYSAIEAAASDLWRLNDEQVLAPFVREGIISGEQRAALLSAHPHYIPFERADFVTDIGNSFIGPGEASLSATGIKKMTLEGSTRALDKPLEKLIAQPVKARNVIFRNRAARGIVEALETLQERTGEDLIRYIEPKRELATVERVTGQTLPRVGKGEHSQVWETISYYRDGVKNTVEVPAIFGRVAKGLEAEPDNILLAVVRVLNAPLRLGATQYNPFFLPVNVMRDAMSGFYRAKTIPFGPNYFMGLWGAIRKNALFSEAAADGALMSGIVENMRVPTRAVLGRPSMGRLELSNAKDALLLIPRLISEANIAFERGIRLGVYRKARIEGLDRLTAAIRARDATVDFAKAGHAMRVINQVVPFSNAALQGSANMVRTLRTNPRWAAAAATMFATPSILSRVGNMRFESSGLIPDYEYTRHWVIQIGEGRKKDGSAFPVYIKIPKGEIAAMFTFPVEALFHLARQREDRSAVEIVLGSGWQALRTASPIDPETGLSSLVPAPIGTATDIRSGVSSFTGQPIVPRREQALLPEQQFGEETSAIAVALGKRFRISPRLIDFAINDYTAGAGQSTNWLLGMALEAAGYQPQVFGAGRPEQAIEGATTLETISRVPGVARFFGTRGTQLERRGWEQFRAAVRETNREFDRIPGMNELGIRLGEVGDSIGKFEMAPIERAEYQRLMAEEVISGIRELQVGFPRSREVIQREMQRLKDIARKKMLNKIGRSQPEIIKIGQ